MHDIKIMDTTFTTSLVGDGRVMLLFTITIRNIPKRDQAMDLNNLRYKSKQLINILKRTMEKDNSKIKRRVHKIAHTRVRKKIN